MIKTIISLVVAALPLTAMAASRDYCDYVDPFIGTQGEGNTFPGAALPFGMVKLGPDCGNLQSNSGYFAHGGVKGFSHTHVSGTGGGCKYGNILITPFTTDRPDPSFQHSRDYEKASPGYFAMGLDGGKVATEMTVSPHAAIHRYTFADPSTQGIFIEAGSLLGRHYGFGEAQNLINSQIEIISPTEVSGFSRQDGGWNMGGAFTVYFYAMFSKPFESFGTWTENGNITSGKDLAIGNGESTGAWMKFNDRDNKSLEVKVGISYVSIAQARRNCIEEVAGKSFEEVLASARDTWNNYLGRIDIDSTDRDELTKFYTALYHTFLQPTDKTGENAQWAGNGPYYDDFYALWDTFRTNHPLYTLIAREREGEIVNSLIDTYRHTGFMPDSRSGDSNGRTQGGSNGDMIVAEAIIKDIPGIDLEGALEAMLKDAEADPGTAARRHGRGGISDYKEKGYVSTDYERSGVRTVEYAANDYAIALAADKLGRKDLARKYADRASNWENLWKDVTFDGISGFIMPRRADGEWDDTYKEPTWDYYASTPEYTLDIYPYKEIPDSCRSSHEFTASTGGSWVNIFYESNSWEYSLYVPQDMAALIEKCGGKESFVNRLDHFFAKNHYNINNEPGFLTPCLYIYAGRHDKATSKIAEILQKHYTSKPDGLPGNDDSGSMSSWYAFHKLGLFPVAGQDIYLLTAPHFDNSTLKLGEDHSVTISAKKRNAKNIYVSRVEIDGKPWHKPWIKHSDLKPGTHITFTMADKPSNWFGSNVPPSKSEVF